MNTNTDSSISNEKVLKLLTKKAKDNNIHLTMSEKAFFILFMELCFKEGEFNDEKNSYIIHLSSLEIAERLGFSLNFVNTAFLKLDKCNLIERIQVQNFKKLKGGNYIVKKPYETILNMNLFE